MSVLFVDSRILLPAKYLFLVLYSFHFPGYNYILTLIFIRATLEAFSKYCESQMQKKFKSFSSFSVKYTAEIKFILFGNVGSYNFTQQDLDVIMKHTWDFWEAETFLSGLFMQPPLPRLRLSVHHHGVQATNEEIEQLKIDEELYERWTSPKVLVFNFVKKIVIRSTNALYRSVLKLFSRMLHFGAVRIDRKLDDVVNSPSDIINEQIINCNNGPGGGGGGSRSRTASSRGGDMRVLLSMNSSR